MDNLCRKKGKTITLKFLNLHPEKRERIINAAFKEFAQKGFKDASTNQIVRDADISKGLLFHYFNNKKNLFLFLYDYAVEFVTSEIFGKVDFDQKDLIKKIQQIVQIKMALFNKHPEMFDFLLKAITDESSEIKRELENKNKTMMINSYSKLFADFDPSVFKESVDIEKAIDIIMWTMEGFSAREQEKMKTIPGYKMDDKEVFIQFDGYLKLLKGCFYK